MPARMVRARKAGRRLHRLIIRAKALLRTRMVVFGANEPRALIVRPPGVCWCWVGSLEDIVGGCAIEAAGGSNKDRVIELAIGRRSVVSGNTPPK